MLILFFKVTHTTQKPCSVQSDLNVRDLVTSNGEIEQCNTSPHSLVSVQSFWQWLSRNVFFFNLLCNYSIMTLIARILIGRLVFSTCPHWFCSVRVTSWATTPNRLFTLCSCSRSRGFLITCCCCRSDTAAAAGQRSNPNQIHTFTVLCSTCVCRVCWGRRSQTTRTITCCWFVSSSSGPSQLSITIWFNTTRSCCCTTARRWRGQSSDQTTITKRLRFINKFKLRRRTKKKKDPSVTYSHFLFLAPPAGLPWSSY